MLSSVQCHVPVACPPIRPPVCPRGRCAAGKRGLLGSEVLPDGEAVLAAERGAPGPHHALPAQSGGQRCIWARARGPGPRRWCCPVSPETLTSDQRVGCWSSWEAQAHDHCSLPEAVVHGAALGSRPQCGSVGL